MFILDIGAASLYQSPAALQIVPILQFLFSTVAEAEQNAAHPNKVLKKVDEGHTTGTTAGQHYYYAHGRVRLLRNGSRQLLTKAHGRVLLLKKESRNQFLTKYGKLPVCITVN
jgi:hypothetical protein